MNASHVEENKSTLNYASKASNIANRPIKNDDPQIKMVETLKRQVKVLTEECIKANKHILDISLVKGEVGKYFGTDDLKKQFKEENSMMLTTQGFNTATSPNETLKDQNSLPPLANFSTPGKSSGVKTHTEQFYDYDKTDEKANGSAVTSPKLAKAKSSFNAEAYK
jgi:hypothetical protein